VGGSDSLGHLQTLYRCEDSHTFTHTHTQMNGLCCADSVQVTDRALLTTGGQAHRSEFGVEAVERIIITHEELK